MGSPEVLAMLTTCEGPWETVAMAKAKMPWYVSEYAVAKYQSTDDTKVQNARKVYGNLFLEAMTWKFTDSWPKGMTHKLCKMAVALDMFGERCVTCDGIGQAVIMERKVTCLHCNGSGKVRYSMRKIAEILDVDRSTYARVWHNKLQVLMRRLAMWDSQVFDKCREIGRE